MMKKLSELSLHTHFSIRTVIVVIGVIITLISQSSSRNEINAGMIVGLILIVCGILWHILFVRCPHCGSHLSLKQALPKYCPWCGKHIDKFH